MKKKFLIIVSIAFVFVALLGSSIYLLISRKDFPKYFIIGEMIAHGEKTFVTQPDNLIAVNLGQQIGVTDEGQQIFEVEGQMPDQWICVRVDGIEKIYRESGVHYLNFSLFNADKIIVKEPEANFSGYVTIIEAEILQTIQNDFVKENLVQFPETYTDVKQLNFYSNEFTGFCFIMNYIHDEIAGIWKLEKGSVILCS